MWAEVDGERKKVACGPCIRGHRSSKCDHRDRVLVEVRKPGRPLSSCPHPSGSCSCERIVINYTIPKSSECACPSERAQSVTTVSGNSRVQKSRRKSTVVNPIALERAIKAGLDAETDTSSYTRTPTERSGSDEASPPSSASSTPRLPSAQRGSVSSCCQPTPVEEPVQRPAQQSGCCSSKSKHEPEPVQKKSCCSGTKVQASNLQSQTHAHQPHGQQFQFQLQPQNHPPQYSNMQAQGSVPPSHPFGLGAPIYNHAAAAYHQYNSASMSPIMNGHMSPPIARPPIGQHAPEHNCHCGESCSCFGCAAHPNNATMMEYIRLMAQFQYTGGFGAVPPPLYDMPTYPHHPGFGAEAHPPMSFSSINTFSTPTQMSFNNSNMHLGSIPSTRMTSSTAWSQAPTVISSLAGPHFFEPSDCVESTPITEVPLSSKTEEPVATPIADSPSDGKDEETPTLSPSSYFWNQMVLPNCSDDTGTCQCGDGCECVGCLTHGGHNGVQLDAPSISDANTLSDFTADTGGLDLDDDTAHFLFNAAAT
ncbi:hypothetical protein BDU57DRAFT_196521 [Ampelomyces quisqualis]|uniref:Copper-fist domain-containing protein n=1 Tax=Ampelomyces quisqualis TaxID=50730 RepID=A0A6A5QRQ5_AMPQU|nr:hypothetical protein BDU57DRAFT_196521 [Ampelomyces quisqualis]